mmetsp:Transcript_161406/g.286264  ORF Transcript_161406/g.286264 Transcript_161406/m.286264 type:complete len:779 (-) Transcript_161406:206-2542(-)
MIPSAAQSAPAGTNVESFNLSVTESELLPSSATGWPNSGVPIATASEEGQLCSDFWAAMSTLQTLHERITTAYLQDIAAVQLSKTEFVDHSGGHSAQHLLHKCKQDAKSNYRHEEDYHILSERLHSDSQLPNVAKTQSCSPTSMMHQREHVHRAEVTKREDSVIDIGSMDDVLDSFPLHEEGGDKHETQQQELEQVSQSTEVNRFDSDTNRQGREQRFATSLQAQLRAQWILSDDVLSVIPDWDKADMAKFYSITRSTFSLDELPAEGMTFRKLKRQWFDAGTILKQTFHTEGMACLFHPHSYWKVGFDMVGAMFMLYDFTTTPLHFFDFAESDFGLIMNWVTRMFWILDMWLNFQTATFVKGVLTTKRSQIAKKYLKNMFFPDLLLVLTEWVAFVASFMVDDNNSSFQNVNFFRILKVLRFAKVIRIIKLEQVISELLVRVNSTYLLLVMRPIFLIVGLLFFNHVIACFWYGLGNLDSTGWLSIQKEHSKMYLYWTSFHWALSLLHGNVDVYPGNIRERIFQCSFSVIALVLFSTLLSSITNAMMQIRSLRREAFEWRYKLREIFAQRQISIELRTKIHKCLAYNAKIIHCNVDDDEKIIKRLPQYLVKDFSFESFSPVVNHHDYFFMLGYRCPQVLRQLCCDAMDLIIQNQIDETIFHTGDACQAMFFIDHGFLEYVPGHMKLLHPSKVSESVDQETVQLARKDFLCEAVLWMTWEYCGLLVSKSPVRLLSIYAENFAHVVKQFHFAFVNSVRYATEFLDRMVRTGRRTDLALNDG